MGNNIIHRYVKDGKRYKEVVSEFDYDLYLRSEYSDDSVDVKNNTLKRYNFDNISDMRNFIDENKPENVYGNTDPVAQFIAKKYPDEIKLTNEYVVLNFDIEVEHAQGKLKYFPQHPVKARFEGTYQEMDIVLDDIKTYKEPLEIFDEEKQDWLLFEHTCYAPKSLGFPDPNLALYEVLSISLIAGEDKVIHVFGTKDFNGPKTIEGSEYVINYIYTPNEKELLIRFIQKWREIRPDILTGWNVEGFDVPYIVNRIVRVLGKKFANMLSPFSSESSNCIRERQKDDNVYYSIAGISVFDYMSLYKKFSRGKQESYKLDWIGQVEVNHKKISYEEFDNSLMKLWEFGYDKFILYNAIDTLIVNKLDEKLKFINLAITIAHVTKSDLSEAMATIKPWDNIIYNLLRAKNIQIPPNLRQEKIKEFLGAFVKDPLLGRHGWTLTFDLTSLYPSILRMLGMSPETLVDREVGSNIYANRDVRLSIHDNINTITDIIESKNYGEIDEYPTDINIEEIFSADYIKSTLRTLSLNSLQKILSKMDELDYYYGSGHEYIHGIRTVESAIVGMINHSMDLSFAKDRNVTVAGNGSTYDKSIEGVIPSAMEFLFNQRVKLKNEMKEKKKLLQKMIEEEKDLNI